MSNTRPACTTNNPDRHLNGAWRPHNGNFHPHGSAMAWLAACPVFARPLPPRPAACLAGPAACLPGPSGVLAIPPLPSRARRFLLR